MELYATRSLALPQIYQWVPQAAAAQKRDPMRLLPKPLPENIVIRPANKRGSHNLLLINVKTMLTDRLI